MTEEEATKAKGKVTVSARIKKAGSDEWIDLGVLDEQEVDEKEHYNG